MPENAAKQKDLVQRLETTLIHWTRQIKEVVNRQDDGEDAEDAGPLAEVRFWGDRTLDLSGIHNQLERNGVKQIVAVLDLAKVRPTRRGLARLIPVPVHACPCQLSALMPRV